MGSTKAISSARVSVAGILALVMIGVFDVAHVLMTPCRFEFATGRYYVPWGCSFAMQTGGRLITVAGIVVGAVLGWLVT